MHCFSCTAVFILQGEYFYEFLCIAINIYAIIAGNISLLKGIVVLQLRKESYDAA